MATVIERIKFCKIPDGGFTSYSSDCKSVHKTGEAKSSEEWETYISY
jgi:hypothetical protein